MGVDLEDFLALGQIDSLPGLLSLGSGGDGVRDRVEKFHVLHTTPTQYRLPSPLAGQLPTLKQHMMVSGSLTTLKSHKSLTQIKTS
jgi:hypothetical protein